ncbi:hypothetical protein D3C77_151930 [compost metagenome]
MAGEGCELVRRGNKRQAGKGGKLCGDGFGKTVRGVQPGAHGGAALGQLAHRRQGRANGALGVVELGDISREFLAEGDRRGIHHMGAAGFHQVLMAHCQFGQPRRQLDDRRQQLVLYRLGSRDVHGGGEAVVGALRAVDVIVGVHWRFAATALAGQFVGPTGDHFVDVHVALSATAGLPDDEWKLVVQLPVEHFVGGLFDQSGDIRRKVSVAVVDPGCGFFDQCQGMQNRQRHALLADGKVDQRALRLGTPVGLVRNFDLPQAVSFDTAHAALTPLWSEFAV